MFGTENNLTEVSIKYQAFKKMESCILK